METLPQLPQPHTFYCEREHCGRPIDLWDWDWSSREDPDGVLPALCLDHAIALAPLQEQDSLRSLGTMNRQVRQWVGDPPGTLIAWEETIEAKGGRNAGPFPAKVFGIGVDVWDESWPQTVGSWGGGDDRPALLVILGAFVTTEWDIGAAWRFFWSWQRPEMDASCELLNWRAAPVTLSSAERMMAALAAFREFSAPGPGKPRGTYKRSRTWYLNTLRAYANAIRREPTREEFCAKYKIDSKTLRRNLSYYQLWPWEEFLKRGLGSSRARTIKV